MRRIFVLALAALALLGVVTPDAFAQAPTPTFKINGLIDQCDDVFPQYEQLRRRPRQERQAVVHGRTRGRFDFIGEVGKAKGVLGIEIDLAYGQTGAGDNNIQTTASAGLFRLHRQLSTSTPTSGPSSSSSGSTPSSSCP